MSRFTKTEYISTEVNSYNQESEVDYTTTFNLTLKEWEALANAVEKAIDAQVTLGSYSNPEVVILNEQEVTVSKDIDFFDNYSSAISIWGGDEMGTYNVNLTVGAACDLLDAIEAEIL